MKKVHLLNLLVLIGVLVTASACVKKGPQQADLPNIGKIQVGHLGSLGYSPFFVALEKGYFKELGLDVELTRFDSGSKMIAPLSTGQLDVGAGEPGTALFNAVHQGLDLKVVCGFSSAKEGYPSVPFVVRKDLHDSGDIKTPADLMGRKVGINAPRGLAEYIVNEVLAKGGLTIDEVELVQIPFQEMPAALANGAIDAGHLPGTMASKAVSTGAAYMMFRGDDIAGEIQSTVMYFGKRFLEPANRETAVRFLMAYLKANRELQGDAWRAEDKVKIINQYTGFTPEVILSSIVSYSDPNCALIESSLDKLQAYYLSRDYPDYTEPLLNSEFLDPSFAEDAIERIGLYEESAP